MRDRDQTLAALRKEPFNPLRPAGGDLVRFGPVWVAGEYPPLAPGRERQESRARREREEQELGLNWKTPAGRAWELFSPVPAAPAAPPAAPAPAAAPASAAAPTPAVPPAVVPAAPVVPPDAKK